LSPSDFGAQRRTRQEADVWRSTVREIPYTKGLQIVLYYTE